jgi:hypothetical protein
MKRFLPAIVALLGLVAYGVAEGLWTHRWFASTALAEAAARLQQLPQSVADWQGNDQELDARQVIQAEMTGYVMRRYVQQRTGASVMVLLVCGRPGPTSLHSPEICYPGAGFTPAAAPVRKAFEASASGSLGDFWAGQFQKAGPAPEALRIFWSWNGAGTWEAADTPRLHFAHHRALYKLYVIRQLPRPDEPLAQDPTLDFLDHFLPQVQRTLFPSTEPEPGRAQS